MREKLQKLEQAARRLDPDARTRGQWREAADAYAERFLEELEDLPAYRPGFGEPDGVLAQPFAEEPAGIEE